MAWEMEAEGSKVITHRRPQMKTMMVFLILLMGWGALARGEEIQTESSGGLLFAQVFEKGTRQPLSGVQLVLEPTGENAPLGVVPFLGMSDETGRFQFPTVPAGKYRLVAAAVSYQKPAPVEIEIKEGEEQTRVLYLEREPISMLEILVEEERKTPDPGRKTLQKEEIEKIPGTGGDQLLAIQNLPGVTPAVEGIGYFYTRGSGPFDNQVFLDQMPVLLPFHFIGLVSTVSPDLIRSADFYAGGFGSRYGNAMGGVIEMTSRDGRGDRLAGRLNLSPVLLEGRVEGPARGNSTFFLAGRQGLLENLPLSTDEGTFIPTFNDYQAKWSIPISDRHRLAFLFFGSHDGFVFKADKPNPRDPIVSSFNSNLTLHNQGVTLHSFLTPRWTSTLTLFNNYNEQHTTIGSDLFADVVSDQVRLKGHFVHTRPSHRLATGFEVGQAWYRFRSRLTRPCGEGDPACNVTDAPRFRTDLSESVYGGSFYLEETFHPDRRFEITLGGRIDYFSPTRAVDPNPRASALFRLTENDRIKVAYGYYTQWPQPVEYVKGVGNPEVRSPRSIHSVLGYQRSFGAGTDLDLQVYYKEMDRLVVPSGELGVFYNNDGVGYSAGAELLLRQRIGDRFFGWLSYSFSKTQRRVGPGEAWRDSDYDRPHAVTLVATYQLNRRWNIGGRWRFLSGSPYTPLIDSRLNPATGRYETTFGNTNSKRLPSTHRLDLRAEYKKPYDTWILTVYLEIWNVYNRLNPIGVSYQENVAERKVDQKIERLFGIIPFFGVAAEF
ncbi:MAG: TonB-dependent receptor plug domain-containing protein [Candidatus Manganitrophaceae bacterium]